MLHHHRLWDGVSVGGAVALAGCASWAATAVAAVAVVSPLDEDDTLDEEFADKVDAGADARLLLVELFWLSLLLLNIDEKMDEKNPVSSVLPVPVLPAAGTW